MKLGFNINGNEIICSGDVELLAKSRNRVRLKSYGYEIVQKDNNTIIKHEDFPSNNSIYNFSKYAKKIFRNKCDMSFSNDFNAIISDEIKEEESFIKFKEKAKQIWYGNFNEDDLKEFSKVVKKRMRRTLYDLQLKSAYHLAFSQNSCNFSVPGSGKTSIVYGAYAFLKNSQDPLKKVNKLVVFGPPSSFDAWEDEYLECFGKRAEMFRVSGDVSFRKKFEVLTGRSLKEPEIILLTYNSIVNIKELLQEFLDRHDVMLVCDEAHRIKRVDGQWATRMIEIAPKAKSRVVLTGTPCPNGYEDLYNLFKFLYPKRNVTGYHYEFLKSLTERPITYEVENVINNLKPYFVRIKKEDLKLPEFKDHDIICNTLSTLESEVYLKFEKALGTENSELHKMTILMRMWQSSTNLRLVRNGIIGEDEHEGLQELEYKNLLGEELYERVLNLKGYIPTKFFKILDLLERLKKEKKRVIIWGYFTDSIKFLDTFLKGKGFVGDYIVGETPNINDEYVSESNEISRSSKINFFKDEKSNIDYLITNPIILGESVSLHKVCHDSLYFEKSYSLAPYAQSRDRIHRVWLDENQKQYNYETNYYHIISWESIDKYIHQKINMKFNRMLDTINQEIPLFTENIEQDKIEIMREIIKDYKKQTV